MSAKICVIVGFGSGVSTGVAKAFAQEGYTLALVARNRAKLTENTQVLANFPVHTFTADAGSEASLSQAFAQIREQLGDPEVLIYNAAVFTPGRPSTLSAEQVVADFRANVVGALVSAQQVIPAMGAKGQGTILFTGGGFALYPWMEAASLSIGKAGIRSLAYTLAQELAETGIHVATVTIAGTVEPGTHFDPDIIAQSYLALHRQSPGTFEQEIIYK